MTQHGKRNVPKSGKDRANVDLGSAKDVALRLVAAGAFNSVFRACRANLRRLDEGARLVDRLAELGAEGMASGVDADFDIDAFVHEIRSEA